METMKAAIVNEFKKQLEIKEVEKPTLNYGEVLVALRHVGYAIQIFTPPMVIGR